MDWIRCSDRLPEECVDVLVYRKHNNPISAFLIIDVEGEHLEWRVNDWDESEQALSLSFVTHWMPLPEPPKD